MLIQAILREAKWTVRKKDCDNGVLLLVWPTSWTPAIGGLIVCVCESVCPKTCRHIARRMNKNFIDPIRNTFKY